MSASRRKQAKWRRMLMRLWGLKGKMRRVPPRYGVPRADGVTFADPLAQAIYDEVDAGFGEFTIETRRIAWHGLTAR